MYKNRRTVTKYKYLKPKNVQEITESFLKTEC